MLNGYTAALKPSGMGERRSPALLAIGDNEPPFEIDEGRWIQAPYECVVGSAAEDIIVAVPGEKALRTIKIGDKLDVTTDAGVTQFTVVGKLRQKLPQDIRGQTGGMYAFGFGIGLGGKPMGGPAATPPNPPKGAATQQPAPPLRRRGRRMGGAEVSPTTPSVYISMDDMAAVFDRDIPSNIVFVQLVDNADYDAFYRDIEQKLGGTLQDWNLKSYDPRVKQKQSEGGMSPQQIVAQAWSTVGIVIVASVFIIFTTLSMGVSTRTRQLAMLRAIGLTRLQVALYIILEGLALGVIGWIGGMAAGWLLLTGLVYADTGGLPLVTLSLVAVLFTGACSLCGACTEHCPVSIPIHDLVRQHRINIVDQGKNHLIEVPIFKALGLFWSSLPIYMMGMKVGAPVMELLAHDGVLDASSAWIPVVKGWTSTRDFDILSKSRFRTWFKEHKEEQKNAEGGEQ